MTEIQKMALKDTVKTMSVILLLVAVLFGVALLLPLEVIVLAMIFVLFAYGSIMLYEHFVYKHSHKIK